MEQKISVDFILIVERLSTLVQSQVTSRTINFNNWGRALSQLHDLRFFLPNSWTPILISCKLLLSLELGSVKIYTSYLFYRTYYSILFPKFSPQACTPLSWLLAGFFFNLSYNFNKKTDFLWFYGARATTEYKCSVCDWEREWEKMLSRTVGHRFVVLKS